MAIDTIVMSMNVIDTAKIMAASTSFEPLPLTFSAASAWFPLVVVIPSSSRSDLRERIGTADAEREPFFAVDLKRLVWNGSRLGMVDHGVNEWHETEHDIRATGLRCTTQRVAVLDVLRRSGGHQPVATIVEGARRRLGRISSQSVYDALDALASHGLVQRIEPAGSPALFEAADEPHRHAVCRRCGTVGDVELRHEPPGGLALRSAHGWALDEVEITFWGLCPTCAAAARDRPDPT